MKEIIEYHTNGNIKTILLKYNSNHSQEIQHFASDGKTLYNENNPCIIEFEDNKLCRLSWFNKDIKDDRPDRIEYYENGYVSCFAWGSLNKKVFVIHKNNGPAFIHFDRTGKLNRYVYFLNGMLHRVDGPAAWSPYLKYSWYYYNKDYTIEVNKWFKDSKIDNWQDMYESDFNRMWFELL